MIKSLSNITDISVFDQNGINDVYSFSKIEFDDSAFGSGGFGSVHNVLAIDGIQRTEFVLKISTEEETKQHAYDVVSILHYKLKKHQLKAKIPIYHDLPELLGLPFLTFKGYDSVSEKNCVCFLMYNLEKLNYEDFGSDTVLSDTYKSLQIPNKLYLAYQLSKTIEFLHSIDFIHADISENSLWFNPIRVQLAIIDFDSGYHFDSQEKPSTLGKLWQGTTGFFKKVFSGDIDKNKLKTEDRLYEEYFWLAHHVFEIVFGVPPYFFLVDADDKSKLDYLKENEWPNIDYSSSLFNKANAQQHEAVVSFVDQLDNGGAKDLIDAFKKVFNSGYKDGAKRLTSKEWRDLLFKLNEELKNVPLINNFDSNKVEIKRKNELVDFSLDIQKSNSIYINDKLVPLHQKSIKIPLEDGGEVLLKAKNDFETVKQVIEIKAVKVDPIISVFEASKIVRDTLEPITLNWETKNIAEVTINSINSSTDETGDLKVSPTEKTNYTLTARGYFDEVVTKRLEIDIIKPSIEYFNWEVNLNKGITNVDISWKVLNADSVKITPHVKSNNIEGIEHISISERTEFKLVSKGVFIDVESEITAHPFPVPVVKQIFTEAPKIEINTNVDFTESRMPKELLQLNNIRFNNNVNFNNLEIDSTELKSKLEFPKFENENALIKKFSKKKITLSDIYDSVLEKIHKRLNK